MSTEKLTPAQQVFINEVVNGASQKQAYLVAYPGSSIEAAYSSASRLMEKPHIRQRIEAVTEELALLKRAIKISQYAERLVTISRQRDALTPGFTTTFTKTETITNYKGQTLNKNSFDLGKRLSAIRLDDKLYKEWNKLIDDLNDKEMINLVIKEIYAMKEDIIARDVSATQLLRDGSYFPQDHAGLENEPEITAGAGSTYENPSHNSSNAINTMEAFRYPHELLEDEMEMNEVEIAGLSRHLNRRQRRALEKDGKAKTAKNLSIS